MLGKYCALLSSVLLLCVFLTGCGGPSAAASIETESTVTISEPAVLESSSSEEPSSAEPSSAASSKKPASSSKKPSSSPPKQTSSQKPASKATGGEAIAGFDNTAFLGNSFIDMLRNYGRPANADFYSKVGLTVKTAFTKSMQGSSVPVIDELNDGQYDKIFTAFGENELGWEYPDIFLREYGKVIGAVRRKQPQAEIYILGILPVSAEVSAKNVDKLNNGRIREFNSLLNGFAQEQGVSFIDATSVLTDENGNLPREAATDGIHLSKQYSNIWITYIKDHL